MEARIVESSCLGSVSMEGLSDLSSAWLSHLVPHVVVQSWPLAMVAGKQLNDILHFFKMVRW
jgi:hypothetical protein